MTITPAGRNGRTLTDSGTLQPADALPAIDRVLTWSLVTGKKLPLCQCSLRIALHRSRSQHYFNFDRIESIGGNIWITLVLAAHS